MILDRNIEILMMLSVDQGLSQDLKTECRKLAIANLWGIPFFKGELNILRLQP